MSLNPLDLVKSLLPESKADDPSNLDSGLVNILEQVTRIQMPAVEAFLDRARDNQESTPREVQDKLDKIYTGLLQGSGAAAGLASAIPGVGLLTGAAAITGETLALMQLSALYVLASAKLRGEDLADQEVRRGLILGVFLESTGASLADFMLGRQASRGVSGRSMSQLLRTLSGARLNALNQRLLSAVVRRMATRSLGKFVPLGVGAAIGVVANRKLAQELRKAVAQQLGPVPASF